jgi:hypothetical protein
MTLEDVDKDELAQMINFHKNKNSPGYRVTVSALWGPSVMNCNGTAYVMIIGTDYANYQKRMPWLNKFHQLTSWDDNALVKTQIIALISEGLDLKLLELIDYFGASKEQRAQRIVLV